jgi:hypothetical protein
VTSIKYRLPKFPVKVTHSSVERICRKESHTSRGFDRRAGAEADIVAKIIEFYIPEASRERWRGYRLRDAGR